MTIPLSFFFPPLIFIPETYYEVSLINILAINYKLNEEDINKYGLYECNIYEKKWKNWRGKNKQKFEDIFY